MLAKTTTFTRAVRVKCEIVVKVQTSFFFSKVSDFEALIFTMCSEIKLISVNILLWFMIYYSYM